jgi:glucuronoarabinoxylan endo-1,4-beta-xylanase
MIKKVLVVVALVTIGSGYVVSASQDPTPQTVEQMRALVIEIEAKLAQLKALMEPPPPPPPVDCVMSDWAFESATDWSTCSAEGVQTRQETWDRTILTEPANGGVACPTNTLDVRTVSQACKPPPVVDCQMSEWSLDSATAWSACIDGTQTRQETWSRTVQVEPQNGGASCGELTQLRSAEQPCQEPPVGGAHDYFNALVTRPDHAVSYSLRDQAQLQQYSQKAPDGSQDINYLWPNDPDPRKQDAAKLVVPSTGVGGWKSQDNRNSIYQVRVPMPPMALGHSYLVVWDAWYGAEWDYDITGVASYKAFQFDGPDRPGGPAKIWWEQNNGYQGNKVYPVADGELAHARVRHYAISWRQSSSGTWFGVPAGPNVTTGSTSTTPTQPHTPFMLKAGKWVRYWQLIEFGMDSQTVADYNGGPLEGVPNPPKGTLMSFWMADEDRPAVQVYNRLQVTLWEPGVRQFWIEYNTSTNEVKAGRPDLVAYFRNIVVLTDVAFSQVPGLLTQPVSTSMPVPPPPPPPDPDPTADIVVEWNRERQTIDGFGASSYANEFPDAVIANADLLFDQDSGVGLSLMRMGLPHNPDTGGRSYKDPVIAQLAAARGATVWASNFYPPAKWKSNGIPTSGGTLLVQHYQDYATLLADEIEALKAEDGVDLYALSIQNEPDKSQTWGSCVFSDAQMKAFLPVLSAEFQRRNLSTKIMLPEESSWTFRRAASAMSDPVTAAMVGILGAHRYSSPDGWASPYKGIRPIWQTEHSIGSDAAHSITTALTQAVEIHNFLVQSEVNAWHAWNLGVIMGGKRLYTLGNWSKFVRPGWVRIETTQTSDVLTSAFKHRDTGAFAIVLVNPASSSRTRSVGLAGVTATHVVPWVTSDTLDLRAQASLIVTGGVFTAVLPGRSVTTFVGQQGS